MRELVTICAGQKGIQNGARFWEQLCVEHGIGADGSVEEGFPVGRTESFYYVDDEGRYVPRSVFVDMGTSALESQVGRGSSLEKLFSASSFIDAGSGGSWVDGYRGAQSSHDAIFEALQRSAESADSLEGFLFCHDVAISASSGLSTYLLEHLPDLFPKKIIQTFTDFPLDVSVEVVQPINVVLALPALTRSADSVIAFTSDALSQDSVLAATVAAASTATLRFPGSAHTSLCSLIASLVPTPRCHFLTPAFSPLRGAPGAARRTTVSDTLRALLQPRARVSTGAGKYMSLMAILQGDANPADVQHALARIREQNSFDFVPWLPKAIQVVLSPGSPLVQGRLSRIRGLLLANHTSFRAYLDRSYSLFNKFYRGNRFMTGFKDSELFGEDGARLEEYSAVVKSLSTEYKAAESMDYFSS